MLPAYDRTDWPQTYRECHTTGGTASAPCNRTAILTNYQRVLKVI